MVVTSSMSVKELLQDMANEHQIDTDAVELKFLKKKLHLGTTMDEAGITKDSVLRVNCKGLFGGGSRTRMRIKSLHLIPNLERKNYKMAQTDDEVRSGAVVDKLREKLSQQGAMAVPSKQYGSKHCS